MQGDFVAKPTVTNNTQAVTPQTAAPVSPPPQTPPTNIAEAAIAPTPSIGVQAPSHRGRAPLVLTVVGVIIFIGGVSGLFVYALSGQ